VPQVEQEFLTILQHLWYLQTLLMYFPVLSSFMTYQRVCVTRETRRVPQVVEQGLLTFPENMSSTLVFSGIRVARSLIFYVMFCRSLFVLCLFFLWSLCCLCCRCTDSDYLFGKFKLFLNNPQFYIIRFINSGSQCFGTDIPVYGLFLKGKMRRFFKNPWFKSFVLRIRWRCKQCDNKLQAQPWCMSCNM
jgi:hypothetical protein